MLLTGKNGAGKTSVLCEIAEVLKIWQKSQGESDQNYQRELDLMLQNESGQTPQIEVTLSKLNRRAQAQRLLAYAETFKHYLEEQPEERAEKMPRQPGIGLVFSDKESMAEEFFQEKFLMAYYPAERKTSMQLPDGIEKIETRKIYGIDERPGSLLVKYMVHLKTQELYAKNAGDSQLAEKIEEWFQRFENALKELPDDKTVKLFYDYKNYSFQILEDGRESIGFDQLSDGYSAIIDIVSDLMLRMEQNWILKEKLCTYDAEGIVLIDEWNNYMWPLLVIRSSSKYTLTIGLNTLINPYGDNYSLLVVGSVFSIIPIFILFICFQRYFIEGMTAGAVKG